MSFLSWWRAPVGVAPLRTWASVLLVPACLQSPPGLRVTVLNDAAGNAPAAGVVVTVTGTSISAITNASGVALLRPVPAGTRTVVTRLGGFCQASHTVTVNAAAITAVTLYLCTATPAEQPVVLPQPEPTPDQEAAPPADQVTVSNPPGASPLLLFDAAIAGGSCVTDRLVSHASPIPLGVNALAPGTGVCHTSAALFTPNNGLFFTNEAATLAWTAGNDNVGVTLPPLLQVPVTAWVASPLTGTARADLIDQIRLVHLDLAGDILHEAGAGLELVADLAAGGEPEVVDVATLPNSSDLLTAIGSGCGSVSAIRAKAAIYRSSHLNLYYVGALTGPGAGMSGYNCVLDGAREIMFVDDDTGLPHIAAHEIGHALGLLEPFWGHTHSYLAGFLLGSDNKPRNFMAYAATADAGSPIYASRGQAFRMNLSALSWLNLPGADGMTPRQRATALPAPFTTSCPCPAEEGSNDCPLVRLTDLTGTESLGVTWELACEVRLPESSVEVCQDQEVTVKATFHATRNGVLLDARNPDGKTFWLSVDPARATALQQNSGVGWSLGKITGVSVGSTEVVIVAGGPSATAKLGVTVKSCP